MTERQVSLRLSAPRQYTLLYAFGICVILALLSEAIARQPMIQNHLPYQAYGTNHTQLEIQLANLDRFVRENGAPDCFIFGSSQAFRDVDAVTFAEALRKAGGGNYTCYNFGVTGSQVATTAVLNQILIQQYRPRLVVIGTSFLDYSEGRELQIDERFTKNDWLAYRTGHFNLNGWLLDNSYAWRAITLLSYSAPYRMNFIEVLREAHKWDGEIDPAGFALSKTQINPNAPVENAFVKNLKNEFGNFEPSQRNLNALERIAADSQAVGAHVLIAEMPYHPALLDLKDAQGKPRSDRRQILAFRADVNQRIQAIADAHAAIFLPIDSSLVIPETVWFDLYHLNRNGASIFSQWLGAQAAKLPAMLTSLIP